MARKYNIRWNETDEQELRKAVKNFNAKIRRLEKKNPAIKNVLPERVSVAQMKNLIETRQDLNREINSLRRFSRRGSETIVEIPDNDYNLKITKWQKTEMTRRVATINKKRKKKLEELQDVEQTSGGKPLGYTAGQVGMGRIEEVDLNPLKPFSRKMGNKDLKYKFKHILTESQSTYWDRRDLLLKENYIRSIEENFPSSECKFLVDHLVGMPLERFKAVFYREGGHALFEFSYPPSKSERDKALNHLGAVWGVQKPNNTTSDPKPKMTKKSGKKKTTFKKK